MTVHRPLRFSIKILLTCVLIVAISISQGCNCDENHAKIKFIVPNNFEGRIFLIHDPNSNASPKEFEEMKIYEFPENGVLRLKEYDHVRFGNVWIQIFNRNGDELWLANRLFSEGPKYLTVTSYEVSSTEHFPNNFDLRGPVELLQQTKGIKNLSK